MNCYRHFGAWLWIAGLVAHLQGTIGLALVQANTPPHTPIITEPTVDGQMVSAADVHMETSAFSDDDLGDDHLCSDWEIWTLDPVERVWFTECIDGVARVHSHLGDGVFQKSHADRTELFPETDYRLQARHRDNSGDPDTDWSEWGERFFQTGALSEIYPIEVRDVAALPEPAWIDAIGSAIVLPASDTPPFLRLESPLNELFLEIQGADGTSNTVINPAGLGEHEILRVRISAGSLTGSLLLPDTDLSFTDDDGTAHTVYLPTVSVTAEQDQFFWVALGGSTYFAEKGDIEPDFSTLARGAAVPWTVLQRGYRVEVVATGFQLPVNIAFVPSPGEAPGDPFYYVTELYGTIRVVTVDGTVSGYATDLLNYDPTGNFPGSGEQGLAGIVVDPDNGDVYATILHDAGEAHFPRVMHFTSIDGGLTAATEEVILDMVGESQGQSHQISNITFGPDEKLYVHMGDGFDSSTAQDLTSFRGKILRLNRDGTAPRDNPFYDADDGISATDFVFAYGVRNPFGGAWRSADGFHYEVENGPGVDRLAKIVAGTNYLWDGSNDSMENLAIYNWEPAVGPVNIAFVQSDLFGGSQFPAEKMDHAFVSESGPTYAEGPQSDGKRITEFVLDESGNLLSGPTPFIEYNGAGKATVVALTAGPDGLYFSDLYKDLDYLAPIDPGASILRIKFVGGADFTADVTTGKPPLTVQFTDTSNVPRVLTWEWNFGDGESSFKQNPDHTYAADGSYDVTLTVTSADEAFVTQKPDFIIVETRCHGDANGDGVVDPLDVGFVLARFGCPVDSGNPGCVAADQNGDGSVDPLDSGFVLARFGPCP